MSLVDVRARKALVRAQRAAAEAEQDLTMALRVGATPAIARARDVMTTAVLELTAALSDHDDAVTGSDPDKTPVRSLSSMGIRAANVAERVDAILTEGKKP